MAQDVLTIAEAFVREHIGEFHERRLEKLESLKLHGLLRRKNPYLFRAKNLTTGEAIVRPLLDAYLSSQEETLFGNFLEQLAIHICEQAYGGRKSAAQGIDIEFERSGVRYLLAVKSGPNWGNSAQIRKMREDFKAARRILRTSGARVAVEAINGCCYGRIERDYGDYRKLCGQAFWRFISGDDELYIRIIEPLGHDAKRRNDSFEQAYARVVNLFTRQFLDEFCKPTGEVDWPRLVAFVCATQKTDASSQPAG